MMTVKVNRIIFLNQYWQICKDYTAAYKTDKKGMPKFGDFQADHRCYSGHCVNPNHIVLSRRCKLLEGVNADFVWDKCVVHLIVDAVIGVFLA